MIRHHLTFVHEAVAVERRLSLHAGAVLAECWSQERNRLLLHFVSDRDGTAESVYVEIAVDLRTGYVLPRADVARARKNTIDFFDGLLGSRFAGATVDDSERIVRLHFEGDRQLVAFFFGRGSGNVIAVDRGHVIGSFLAHVEEYAGMIAAPHRVEPIDPHELAGRIRQGEAPPSKQLARAMPQLGRRLADEAIDRAGLAGCESLAEVDDATIDRLFAEVDVLLGCCERSDQYMLYHLPDDVVFALTRLESLERRAEQVERFDDIAAAVRAYRAVWNRFHAFAKLHGGMQKRVESMLTRATRRLDLGERGDEGERADEWERIGSLLLANLHEVERGSTTATLTDWEGVSREVRLDPKLTPAENAERYFHRARGARQAASRWHQQRERYASEVAMLKRLLEAVRETTDIDGLREIESSHQDVFAMKGEAEQEGTAERFRRFDVEGGCEVFAGKNAANNDELTLRFARPNDYWLHARGTSGSHVVLRWGDAKSKPPKEALRQAAMIAAYYSGAKGAKLVPVAYTLKKYVRKPKGAAPGAVVMGREEVMMVEPKLPG